MRKAALRRVAEAVERPSAPDDAPADQTLRELELTARLAELDRTIRALERERERFLRLRYSIQLIEAELLHLRSERAEVRHALRAFRATALPERRRSRLPPRLRLASVVLAVLTTLGVAAMAFRTHGENALPATATATPPAAVPRSASAQAPPATSPPPTPTPLAVRWAVVATDQLNVRIGAGLQYPIRRAVPAGTVLRLLRSRADDRGDVWWELEQGGWVHASYLRFAASEEEARAYAERTP